MRERLLQVFFYLVLVLTLFSIWAGFALLVVNKSFYQHLPGYRIGRLCVWELVALIVAGLTAFLMIRRWGTLRILETGQRKFLAMHPNYGVWFLVYVVIGICIAVWQFWIFSQQY